MQIRKSQSREYEKKTHHPQRRQRANNFEDSTEEIISKPMNPAIKRGVIAVLLFLAAILSALSFFQLAGVVGVFVNNFLSLLFGFTRYVVPILLVVWAVLIEKDEDVRGHAHHVIGFILFLLGINGLAHVGLPVTEMWHQAILGYRGGIVGALLAWPLVRLTSIWAAVPILIVITGISLMLITGITISMAINFIRQVVGGLWGWVTNSMLYTRTNLATSNELSSTNEEQLPIITERRLPSAPSAIKNPDTENEDEDEDDSFDEDETDEEEPEDVKILENPEQTAMRLPPRKHIFKPLPAFDLLQANKSKPSAGDTKSGGQLIVDTLKQFGIGSELIEVRVGPTVTQYSLQPEKGIKVSRILALSNDLALALAAHPIRIEAPIPGKPYVGIEVPNERVALVTLRELFEAEEFTRRSSNTHMALGKDVSGKVWTYDLTKMPHLLVAGATGSGKTVCLNTLILSLLYQNTDETLRLIMVDPKRVELTLYNGIPHLLTPVITDTVRAVNALKWTISEMERRYDLLSKVGSRDIASYNKKAGVDKLPFIVFVIDELADLMMQAGAEMEGGIVRLAQMSRAVGIHLIVATQRPSVDVITGLMKANIPARIAFSVASITDSRTILDSAGAEKLLGRGDMLLQTSDMSKPKRIQGAFISEEEMKRVVDYWKADTAPEYNPLVTEKPAGGSSSVFGDKGEEHDVLFEEAKQIVIESGKASTSLLQRRLKLGYARAARIIDELEAAGVVGPGEGAKPREILVLRSADDTMKEVREGMLGVMDENSPDTELEDANQWDIEEEKKNDTEF